MYGNIVGRAGRSRSKDRPAWLPAVKNYISLTQAEFAQSV